LIKFFIVGIKITGFILASVSLERQLNEQYANYLLFYSLISFIAFFSEMGIFYSTSNQQNSVDELNRKAGRVFLSSGLASIAVILATNTLDIFEPSTVTTIFFIICPLVINLNAFLKGILIYKQRSISVAVLDAAAFGLPGFLFFFFIDRLILQDALIVILSTQIFVFFILYAFTCAIYKTLFFPKLNASYSKFEKQMLLSNIFAAPIGHLDLWALNYFVPNVDNSTLLFRDLASKIPNVFFPFLQVILYPKMISFKNKTLSNSFFDQMSKKLLLGGLVPLFVFVVLRGELQNQLNNYFYVFENILILVLFFLRAVGSLLGPLMMRHNRSDLSLIRNILGTCSFILLIASIDFLNLNIDVKVLYSSFVMCLILLSTFDFRIAQILLLSRISSYSKLYFIINLTVVFLVLSMISEMGQL
jgi:hypothetical protein